MKVAIVVGGRWHAFDLAKVLEESGCLYRIVTNYPCWYVRRWGIPRDKIVSLPLTFLIVKMIYKIGGESLMMDCQWFVHRWFAVRAVKFLQGCDIVHGWSQWSEPSLRWAREKGIPTVLERSSSHILEQSRILRNEYKRIGLRWKETHSKIQEMELREYDLCTSVAVPSGFVERSFLERGFPSDKVYRNPLGVNLSMFTPNVGREANKNRAGLRVVYAGSLSVRKGIRDLVEAFRLANIEGSSLKLIGGPTKELQGILSEVPRGVELIGHVKQSELVMHYAEADCFVIASVEEGMAMVQMQALACGLPLICTVNTGGQDLLEMDMTVQSYLGNGVTEYSAGYVVPINAPMAIADCLRRLAADDDLLERKKQAASRVSGEDLDWRLYGKRAIRNYSKLLGES